MINTKVTLAGVELKNPVMTASGTFGSGAEYSEFVDLNKLGGVVTKGVANVPWPGNPTPRVTETASGMLNLTSYMNYTGLRRGDSDYEGYISKGDINMNDLIDAYDISVVATQLEGGVGRKDTLKVSGSLSISTPKRLYQKDELVEIRVYS